MRAGGQDIATLAQQGAAQARLKLSNDLRGALPGQQLGVHFQPTVELASGRIHKAGAPVRAASAAAAVPGGRYPPRVTSRSRWRRSPAV